MIRLVMGALLAAVVLFAWGAVYWVASPLRFAVLSAVPNDRAVVELLNRTLPNSGVYLSPFPHESHTEDPQEAREAFAKRHKEGPLVQITYRKGGVEVGPAFFALGFGQLFVSSLLAGTLLLLALPSLPSYLSRVLFVFLLGVFAAITVNLSTPIWFHDSLAYPLFNALYHATGWLFAGAVLGAIVRPSSPLPLAA